MICPSCKTKNQYYHRFCYYCGYKLDTVKSLQKDAEPESLQKFAQPSQDVEQADLLKMDELDSLDLRSDEIYESSSEDIDKIDKIEDKEDNHGNSIELITDSQSSLYDYLFDDHKTNDFDISREIPLRRYRKGRSSKSKNKLARLCMSVIATALVAFLIFVIWREIGDNIPMPANSSQSIIVSTVVKPTEKDGKPAHQIIFNTANGKEVKILDTVIPVKDGRAEMIIEDSILYALDPVETEEGALEVILDSIISAPGFTDAKETISIILNQPYASLTLIQPSSPEAVVEEDSFKLVFAVEPGSKVFINDNDYSDLVSDDGKMEKDIMIPADSEETYILIRVSREGFLDNIQEIVLRKPVMEVPITLSKSSPIPSQRQWVEISGTTLPGATITADRDTKEAPKVDPETGKFTIYVKAEYPGYIPCILTASLDGKVSSMEVILDGETNVDRYTSTAWKPEYDKMQRNPDLHNGKHFLFKGTIKEVLSTGQKNAFIVNASGNSNSEQLIHVEYWGNDFSFKAGDKIKIFGNRWGNVDDIPRILAKYIYNN